MAGCPRRSTESPLARGASVPQTTRPDLPRPHALPIRGLNVRIALPFLGILTSGRANCALWHEVFGAGAFALTGWSGRLPVIYFRIYVVIPNSLLSFVAFPLLVFGLTVELVRILSPDKSVYLNSLSLFTHLLL